MLHSIIYVRGYAMTEGERNESASDPFCGFNAGSTVFRATPDRTSRADKSVFELPVLRLVTDFGYRHVYQNGADILDPDWAPARDDQGNAGSGIPPQLCSAEMPSERFRRSVQRPAFHTGAPASPRRSTRGASRPARISRAGAYPASMDVEIRASGRTRILREGQIQRDPVRCGDVRRCSEQPTRARSSGDEPRTAGSSSPGTRRIVPITRSQIAFALGLENGERSTARPKARIESSRCRAKMLSRS